jgi:UDP-glucuronate decarboxylase
MSEKKRILVTGGAGFIGSHLCERLLARGDEVVCLDNLFTGSRRNVEALAGHARFTFVQHDILRSLAGVVGAIDEVYNLACPASPVHYQHNPVQTIQTNVVGTYNVLELARLAGARVLQASTSEVYGDPAVHPQPESYFGNVNPVGPRSCYDEGKRCAESMFTDYHHQHRLEVRIARIFNTFGPRMAIDDGRVVSNFVVQALRGEPIVVFGDGEQTRSFCYVDDLVEGLIRLMAWDAPDAHQPVNLGNPEEHAIRDLAELVIRLTGSNSALTRAPLPQDDPRQRRPDIARARRCLGWSPTVPVERGMERTIAYFRQALAPSPIP